MIIAGARWLNGEELCDQLGLFRPSLYYKSLVALQIVIYMAIAYMYRSIPYLDNMKIKYMKKLFWQVIVNEKTGFGGRKTEFRMKYNPSYENTTPLHQSYAVRPSGREEWCGVLWFLVGLPVFVVAAYFFVDGTALIISASA